MVVSLEETMTEETPVLAAIEIEVTPETAMMIGGTMAAAEDLEEV